jgi:beta-N-acetylhexosaminidase
MLSEVLTGILRDSLGFQGLVVTDALDMGGVVRGYGPGEAAVQAFLAGSDILLMPTDPIQAIEAIVQAVEAGRISSSRLDRSVRRILVLKERMGLFTTRQVRLDAVDSVFDRASSKQATARASAEALVLVKDSDAVIDSIRVRKRSLAVVTYGEANAGSVGRTLTAELERRGYATRRFALSPASLPASYDSAQRLLDSARIRLVVVSIRALESKGALGTPAPLVSLLARRFTGGQTLLISLGSPYLLSHVPDVPGYIVGWESNPIVEHALAAALTGDPITGRLPVEIPPSWPVGWGIQRGTQP